MRTSYQRSLLDFWQTATFLQAMAVLQYRQVGAKLTALLVFWRWYWERQWRQRLQAEGMFACTSTTLECNSSIMSVKN